MLPFRYEAPSTLDAAVALLSGDPDARILAGGTDLLVQLRGAAPSPPAVVDVKAIPELGVLELDGAGLRVGAAITCWELSQRLDVREAYPGLVEAAELIGSMQIQSRATLGGNLCNGSPAADTTPALMAIGAECRIVGPSGARRLPVDEFVLAPGRTALAPGELLVELRIPPPPPGSADAYLRFIPRGEMDIAVVGAGVRVELETDGICRAARVALGAVAETPIRVPAAGEALVGTRLEPPALERAAAAAQEAGAPITDKRGTAGYRRRLAGVLTRRAFEIAGQRARGDAGIGR
ncbi:MAG: xanthine dehydrogenase family protein subunit M [Myxococcota bacterium]